MTFTVPVVLCGGSGARLWPLSRRLSPKQFLPLLDGISLFDEAVKRALEVTCVDDDDQRALLCVTVNDHRFLVQDALGSLGVNSDILVEPVSRDTTAAICMAALWLAERYDDATMVVLPSDQVIDKGQEWREVIERGVAAAQSGQWVCLGIKPDNPSNAFGYIQQGPEQIQNSGVFAVGSFLEKPCAVTAEQLCQQGWLWNAGIAIVRADRVLEMVNQHAPEVFLACSEAYKTLEQSEGFLNPGTKEYHKVPSLQIDKTVLEKSDNISVVPFYGHWQDIGRWEAVEQLAAPVGKGNRACGDVIVKNCQGVYVRSPHRLIVALGLEDVAIVDTPDALLVARKNTLNNLDQVVDQLAGDLRPEADVHLRQARPWGHFDIKVNEPGYKVKCVLVRPGESLSSQFHYHRAEHWVVVKGIATVVCDGGISEVNINESIYIRQGVIHRLENRNEVPLELVEVQTGKYLGEDDIVRVDDDYGRTVKPNI